MTYNAARALALLRAGSGNLAASFRDHQEAAIQHVVAGTGKLLVVQKTGWGKSFVYFIAAKLLRENGAGPALLVSPLLSLMRNQLAAAERMGVRAATIHSDNQTEWSAVEAGVQRNEVDVLLISPERFANTQFTTNVLGPIASCISLLVVDEAHCISDWGHDFRPHYRLLERIIRSLPPTLRVLATTATANKRVMTDLIAVLGPNLYTLVGDLTRPSLTLQTIRMPDQAQRLAWLAQSIPYLAGSGIIYTLTVAAANQVAAWLKSRGLAVEAYTGQTEEREPLERALLDNRVKALVATTALGMGYDKPDLAFVIHYQTPASVVAYYQQVGRAGRALSHAYGVLLSGDEDTEITDFFIEGAFPTRDEVGAVLSALEQSPTGLSVPDLLGKVNISKGRVEKAISLLSLEAPAPLVKDGTKYQLTAAPLSEQFWNRAARLTTLRHEEQRQMQEYASLTTGHMDFLIRALDGVPVAPTTAPLPLLPTQPDAALVSEATAFLCRSDIHIEPRKRWPAGGMPKYRIASNSTIAAQAEVGRALCVWGDAGWGRLVRKGLYNDGRIDDAIIAACTALVRSWNPTPSPQWVTCVPSTRRAVVVPDFAARLAASLGLPFYDVLKKTEARPEQKSMANSTQQAHNVDGALGLASQLPPGPVLLVDDLVHSRWTITVATWLLRTNGTSHVFPLALASAAAEQA